MCVVKLGCKSGDYLVHIVFFSVRWVGTEVWMLSVTILLQWPRLAVEEQKNLYFVDGRVGKVPDTEIRGQRPVGKQCALPNIKWSHAMFLKLFVVVIKRSLILELCITFEVYRKPNIQATAKRNMGYAIVKQQQFYWSTFEHTTYWTPITPITGMCLSIQFQMCLLK